MPSNWSVVDSMFPTFKGNESTQQQIAALVDYMRILTEQIQYSLDNLDTSNWNAAALKDFSSDTTKDIGETVALLGQKVEGMAIAINSIEMTLNGMRGLPGRVTAVETDVANIQSAINDMELLLDDLKGLPSRVESTEEEIGYLQLDRDDHEDRISKNESAIEDAQSEIDALAQIVYVKDGVAVVGAEGKPLHIIGEIYINGILYKQENET